MTPDCVLDALVALRTERAIVAARLDALDLVLDNLTRAYPPVLKARKVRKVRKVSRGKALARWASKKSQPVKKGQPVTIAATVSGNAVADRRSGLLTLIAKAEHGLTVPEMRKVGPPMDDKARCNALQQLKHAGSIRRVGNVWMKAAA